MRSLGCFHSPGVPTRPFPAFVRRRGVRGRDAALKRRHAHVAPLEGFLQGLGRSTAAVAFSSGGANHLAVKSGCQIAPSRSAAPNAATRSPTCTRILERSGGDGVHEPLA